MSPAERAISERHAALVAEMSEMLISTGTQPVLARLLALLTFADESGISQAEACAVLGLSAGSVSTGLRQLVAMRVVERVPVLGERTARYRAPVDGPRRNLEATLEQLDAQRDLFERSIAALGREQDRSRQLLESMLFINRRHGEMTAVLLEEMK